MNDSWQRIRQRLLSLGWTPDESVGAEGVQSPNGAMLLNDGLREREDREATRTSLQRRIETMLDSRSKGFEMYEVDAAVADFQQLIDCLDAEDGLTDFATFCTSV